MSSKGGINCEPLPVKPLMCMYLGNAVTYSCLFLFFCRAQNKTEDQGGIPESGFCENSEFFNPEMRKTPEREVT